MNLEDNIIYEISEFCKDHKNCRYCPFDNIKSCVIESKQYGQPQNWKEVVE